MNGSTHHGVASAATLALGALVLASCGQRDPDRTFDADGAALDDPPFAEGGAAGSLGPSLPVGAGVFGLWDATVRYLDPNGLPLIDERYVLLDPTAGYTLFDDDGDDFGSPERLNCYRVDGADRFELQPDGRYLWRDQLVDVRASSDLLDIAVGNRPREVWTRRYGIDPLDLDPCHVQRVTSSVSS